MTIRLTYTALLLALCACTAKPPLEIDELEITQPRPGMMMSAGYMRLRNNSDSAIEITSVTSPQFERVEMHETVIENDIARMRALDGLAIGPGEQVVFERGAKHLMLMKPIGEFDAVTLNLYSQDQLVLTVSAALADPANSE